jgi:hypothetical protein
VTRLTGEDRKQLPRGTERPEMTHRAEEPSELAESIGTISMNTARCYPLDLICSVSAGRHEELVLSRIGQTDEILACERGEGTL